MNKRKFVDNKQLKMLTEVRKLHIIEALLKTEDENILSSVEEVMLLKSNNLKVNKPKFNDILGIITEEEAESMKKIIEDHFEKINEDDWK